MFPESRRPSVRDVARAAGVSAATASRALAGDRRVATDTRDRVLSAAERLGYRPDPLARRLAGARWRIPRAGSGSVIAFVTRDLDAPAASAHYAGIEAGARRLGYGVERFSLNPYRSAREAGRVLWHRGYAGLIVGPIFGGDWEPAFDWSRFIAVATALGSHPLALHEVQQDEFAATMLCLDRLVAAGCTRIGHVDFHEPVDSAEKSALSLAATFFQNARRRAGPRGGGRDGVRISAWRGRFSETAAMVAWVRRERLDGVLGWNDAVAHALRSAGVAIPGDLRFASLRAGADPLIAGSDPRFEEVGAAAAEMLDWQIHRQAHGLPAVKRVVRLAPAWHPGASLPEE